MKGIFWFQLEYFQLEGSLCKLGTHVLPNIKSVCDLWVYRYIDNKLSFHSHVHYVSDWVHSYRLITICFKLFKKKKIDLSVLYFKFYKIYSYILPKIICCSSIYCIAVSSNNINQIEKIHKYLTRKLYYRMFGTWQRHNTFLHHSSQMFNLEALELYPYASNRTWFAEFSECQSFS